MIKTAKLASVSILALLLLAEMAFAQTDPGVQSGNRGTGATIIASDPNGFLPFFQDGQNRFRTWSRFPTARPATTVWDLGLTQISAVHVTRNPRSAELALPSIPNSRLPAAQSPLKTRLRISLPPMAPRGKPGSRSSSTPTAPPIPAIPTAEWKTCSPSAAAAMPAVAICRSPALLLRRQRTTSSSAFPRRCLARA